MDELLKSGGAASLVAMAGVHLFIKLCDLFFRMKAKKDALTDRGIEALSVAVKENTSATQKLEGRMKRFETALKIISGGKWETVKRRIEEVSLD